MREGPTLVASRTREPTPVDERAPRRKVRLVLLVLVAAVVILGAWSALPLTRAATELTAGRRLLVQGRDALVAGDTSTASSAFADAEAAFRRADEHAHSWLVRLGGFLPIAGRNYDVAGELTEIGLRSASAGGLVSTALHELPDGLSSLAPVHGRIPLERMAALAPAVAAARTDLEAARAAAERIPTSYLLPPIARGVDRARVEVDRAVVTIRNTEALLRTLPGFLGDDGIRRYFLAAQSPAELRGTGGFIGSFAILTARDGRLSLGEFREISVLADLAPGEVPAPSEGFREIYDRFGGAGFWRNVNMTADVPAAAAAIEALYDRVEGTALDGTIFVTPQTLAELLTATGPVRAPEVDRTFTADGIVRYLTHDAYEEFGYRAALRKRLLGIAVDRVFERFMLAAEPGAAIQALIDTASGGSFSLHAADPEVQRALERAGVAGELTASGRDVFGVFTSDASATKVDYHVRRSIRYDVTLAAEGSAAVEATVRFDNQAPTNAEPSYALGPYPGTGLDVGEELSFASIYCAPGCELTGATEDGAPAGLEVHREAGLRSLHRYVRVPPGQGRVLELALQVRNAWTGDGTEGLYRLRLQAQATVQPTDAEVVVRVPDGMGVVATNVPMERQGDSVVWHGRLRGDVDLEVRFRRPLTGRVWRAIWG